MEERLLISGVVGFRENGQVSIFMECTSMINRNFVRATLAVVSLALSSCTTMGNVLNPFYEPPTPVALLGEKNDHALGGGAAGKEDSARAALQQMGTYTRAQDAQPVNPVMRPAVVRLMWIPDHLNNAGDLIPAHYYYLKVKKEDWAVTDAFELQGQLGSTNSAATVPYVYEGR